MLDHLIGAWPDQVSRLVRAGQLQPAFDEARSLLTQDSRSLDGLVGIALVCCRGGASERALEYLDSARSIEPTHYRVEALAAWALSDAQRAMEAAGAAERAFALGPDSMRAHILLARILIAGRRIDSAIACLKAALEQDNSIAIGHAMLGSALLMNGAVDQAEAAYRTALKLDRGLSDAWFALSQIRPDALSAEDLAYVRTRAPETTDTGEALQLAHVLAKAHEDNSEYEAALAVLEAPKRAHRSTLRYQFETDVDLFRAAQAFSRPPSEWPGSTCTGAPIFVVGLPRTGTTLLERILSAHPKVTGLGETDAFWRAVKRVGATPGERGLDAAMLRAAADAAPGQLGNEYLRCVAPYQPGPNRWVDKMPLNFFYASAICRAMPNARVICVRREPLDACTANYAQLFTTDHTYYGYALNLEDTARYCALFGRLADHWRRALPPTQYAELHYERLIADQEGETRRLLSFCGLDWDEHCLTFHEAQTPARTASALQVRQPLHARSIGRWRRYGAAIRSAAAILERDDK